MEILGTHLNPFLQEVIKILIRKMVWYVDFCGDVLMEELMSLTFPFIAGLWSLLIRVCIKAFLPIDELIMFPAQLDSPSQIKSDRL